DLETRGGQLLPLRAENQVAVDAVLLAERREVFPAQAEVHGQVGPELPVVLRKQRVGRGAEVALRLRGAARARVCVDLVEERRVALNLASLIMVEESVRIHVSIPKRLLGAVLMSPIGRLRPAASGPRPWKRET